MFVKKNICFILLTIILFFPRVSYANDGFIVNYSGEIHLTRNGVAIELKPGAELRHKDIIETGYGSYVDICMQASGEKRIEAGQNYVVQAAFKTKKSFLNISRNIFKEIASWFSANEDITCGCRNPSKILIIYPRKTFVNVPEFVIIKPLSAGTLYDVSITDVAGSLIYACKTAETLVRLPHINFVADEVYNINISAFSGSKFLASESVVINLISSDFYKKFSKSYRAIKADKKGNSSNYYFESAWLYIKNALYTDSVIELKKFICATADSHVTAKKMMKMSLLKSGFYDVAKPELYKVNNDVSDNLIEHIIKLDLSALIDN